MILAKFYGSLVRFLLRVLCRIDGRELAKIPQTGPCIIVVNHINFLEVPLIYTFLHPREIIGLVKQETWNIPVLGALARAWKAIPLDRSGRDMSALREAEKVLKRGQILAIAPEGTRSGHGKLQRGFPGVSLLAAHSKATIVPLAHWGGEEFWANAKRLKRTRIRVKVGPAFRIHEDGANLGKQRRVEIVDEIMQELAALLPPEYRGEYQTLDGTRHHIEYIGRK